MKKKDIMPLGDRVLIEPLSDESSETASGIIIPDTAKKERPLQGRVIAVGTGRVTDNGTVIPLSVKKGDTVFYSKYAPEEIEVDGEILYIMSESQILATGK